MLGYKLQTGEGWKTVSWMASHEEVPGTFSYPAWTAHYFVKYHVATKPHGIVTEKSAVFLIMQVTTDLWRSLDLQRLSDHAKRTRRNKSPAVRERYKERQEKQKHLHHQDTGKKRDERRNQLCISHKT
ncbi:hypothetical protein BSL78_18268 [Apostichopus japonicus]|uniref:Uncharacterized protein n=1 Tax=Stichopus japonicus TaxID=307972 RepID=A0A2G8KA86_STIJA|nr:hypothetical protein BSL78_18268 [Apostichopus japonicus]